MRSIRADGRPDECAAKLDELFLGVTFSAPALAPEGTVQP